MDSASRNLPLENIQIKKKTYLKWENYTPECPQKVIPRWKIKDIKGEYQNHYNSSIQKHLQKSESQIQNNPNKLKKEAETSQEK